METVNVERFKDPRYARPRYRLRFTNRRPYLADGYTQGSYKRRRDAEHQAFTIMLGHFAAEAMFDSRYTVFHEADSEGGRVTWRVVVRFLNERIGTAPDSDNAWKLAGEHLADIRLVAKDNPNRRPFQGERIA
jgi:hypothetical protein